MKRIVSSPKLWRRRPAGRDLHGLYVLIRLICSIRVLVFITLKLFVGLVLHFAGIFYINRPVAAIQVNDDRNSDRCLRRCNRDDKYGEEDAV
jgi:hypothetical protein